jgi:predicted TPR repeat methyltransferase
MRILQLSSGDLVADRRAGYAAALAEDKEFVAAAELMEQALELVPGWAAGWCLLGDYRNEAGDAAGAITAYRALAERDEDGVFGAGLKLAALGAVSVPVATDVPYVETLFDDYAARFETALVDGLGYVAPARLGELIDAARVGQAPVKRALDLGCGTGLMGERLRAHAHWLEGIDLSAGMIAEADRKGIYDRLEQAELMAFLSSAKEPYDLMAAADVLNYCGALPPILAAAAARLAPGGILAFTLERHEGPEPLVLQPSLRYAHSRVATAAAVTDAGLVLQSLVEKPLRQDRGQPVWGLLAIAAKPTADVAKT